MNTKIQTEPEYQSALRQIKALTDAPPRFPEEAVLEHLVRLVAACKDEHIPIDAPGPAEALCFRRQQEGSTA